MSDGQKSSEKYELKCIKIHRELNPTANYTGHSVEGFNCRCESIGIKTVKVLPDDSGEESYEESYEESDKEEKIIEEEYEEESGEEFEDSIPEVKLDGEDEEDRRMVILRDYQQQALERMNEGWEKIGLIDLPCGMGKTLIASEYLGGIEGHIVVFCKLIEHVKQFAHDLESFTRKHKHVEMVTCKHNRDVENLKSLLVKFPKCILVSTYDSLDVIKVVCDNITPFVVVDEVHNITDNILEWINLLPKCLCMSATPLDEQREEWTTLSHVPLSEAISKGFITDYEVILPLVSEINDDSGEFETRRKNYWQDRSEFILTGMLRTGSRVCVMYQSSIDDCKIFQAGLTTYAKTFFGEEVWSAIVTSETSQKDRDTALMSFGKRSERFQFLFSVRILDECFDNSECDSVFISQPAQSFDDSSNIRTVQRTMRANRLSSRRPHKKARCFVYAGENHKVFDMFERLHRDDVNFVSKIRRMSGKYEKSASAKIRATENEESQELRKRCVIPLTWEELWLKRRNDFKEYVEKNGGKLPTSRTKYGEWNIGLWMVTQKKNKGKNEDRDAMLELIPGWKWANTKIDGEIISMNGVGDAYSYPPEEFQRLVGLFPKWANKSCQIGKFLGMLDPCALYTEDKIHALCEKFWEKIGIDDSEEKA